MRTWRFRRIYQYLSARFLLTPLLILLNFRIPLKQSNSLCFPDTKSPRLSTNTRYLALQLDLELYETTQMPSKKTYHIMALCLTAASLGIYIAVTFAGTHADPETKTRLSHSNLYLFRVNGTEIVTAPGKEFYFSWIGFCTQDDATMLGGERTVPPPEYVTFHAERLTSPMTDYSLNPKLHREAMVELVGGRCLRY
jgi:hypothetical protein